MGKLPPGTLMQRAAAGLASVCAGLVGTVYGARVVVLAGSGDNGGDALHAAARLARRGAAVLAVTAGGRVHDEGAAALRGAGGRLTGADDPSVPAAIGAADLVIDGLLGIGGRGGLREPYAALAGLAARSPAVVVATDLPSGVDADTGVVDGAAVRADVTVTFGTWKPGLLIDPGARYAGVVELIDIGLAPYLEPPDVAGMQAADVAALLPQPSEDSDKYRRGVIGILAGSDRFTGAAALAVGGALRGGAGMIRLVSAESAVAVVRQRWPETVITVTGGDRPAGEEIKAAGRVQAWVAGPGMGTDEQARARLAAVLATDVPVLVDADGLTLVAADRGMLARSAPTLLTPHAGEMSRLLSVGSRRVDPADVEARRLEHARMAAAELGATVLVKGSTTVIAAAGGDSAAGPALVNPTGTSWLATAGTGDVLSGLAGSLLAQGLAPREAAGVATYLHGLAARLAAAGTGGGPGPAEGGSGRAGGRHARGGADAPIGAADVIDALPAAIRAVREVPGR
jgi:ADP-dependent NAD(P)H-hydrate dehydratase / NAD(P)H-hydrate epimerase